MHRYNNHRRYSSGSCQTPLGGKREFYDTTEAAAENRFCKTGVFAIFSRGHIDCLSDLYRLSVDRRILGGTAELQM